MRRGPPELALEPRDSYVGSSYRWEWAHGVVHSPGHLPRLGMGLWSCWLLGGPWALVLAPQPAECFWHSLTDASRKSGFCPLGPHSLLLCTLQPGPLRMRKPVWRRRPWEHLLGVGPSLGNQCRALGRGGWVGGSWEHRRGNQCIEGGPGLSLLICKMETNTYYPPLQALGLPEEHRGQRSVQEVSSASMPTASSTLCSSSPGGHSRVLDPESKLISATLDTLPSLSEPGPACPRERQR